MAEQIGPGSLKCVSGSSSGRSLGSLIEETLSSHVRAEDIRRLYDEVVLVCTEADTAAIRDWLASLVVAGESVLVVEFEHWSGYGAAPDRDWLRRRGH